MRTNSLNLNGQAALTTEAQPIETGDSRRDLALQALLHERQGQDSALQAPFTKTHPVFSLIGGGLLSVSGLMGSVGYGLAKINPQNKLFTNVAALSILAFLVLLPVMTITFLTLYNRSRRHNQDQQAALIADFASRYGSPYWREISADNTLKGTRLENLTHVKKLENVTEGKVAGYDYQACTIGRSQAAASKEYNVVQPSLNRTLVASGAAISAVKMTQDLYAAKFALCIVQAPHAPTASVLAGVNVESLEDRLYIYVPVTDNNIPFAYARVLTAAYKILVGKDQLL
jgi:hypothetical protein